MKERTSIERSPAIKAQLDTLWDQYKRSWHRLLPGRFLKELKLRSQIEVTPLQVRQVANRIPRGSIPDCENCQDLCCYSLENMVSLRLVDIAVLIDIDRTDLIDTARPRISSKAEANGPALKELANSRWWRTLPVLKQIGPNHACAALSINGECSLYPHWPLSCERFPYNLNILGREVSWGTRCASRKLAEEHSPRSQEILHSTVKSYNEYIRDAVLITHAREALDDMGVGQWLGDPSQDIFGPAPILPIVD